MLGLALDDEPERRRPAPVPARSAQNAAAHPAALLRIQGHLGLGDFVPDFLHGHHGSVQRGLQKQDLRGRVAAGGGLNSGCDILYRYCAQLSHDFRGPGGRGGVRPPGHPHELFEIVVRNRPSLLSAL